MWIVSGRTPVVINGSSFPHQKIAIVLARAAVAPFTSPKRVQRASMSMPVRTDSQVATTARCPGQLFERSRITAGTRRGAVRRDAATQHRAAARNACAARCIVGRRASAARAEPRCQLRRRRACPGAPPAAAECHCGLAPRRTDHLRWGKRRPNQIENSVLDFL